MKKISLSHFGFLKVLFLAAFLVFGFVSCEKDDLGSVNEVSASKFTVSETLEIMNNEAKRSPAPGDVPIAGIAAASGFDELIDALLYVDEELDAGLVNLFANGKDQYTVFAPTNQAFFDLYNALNVGSIDEIPAPVVLKVLKYHVVEGRRGANSVVPKNKARKVTTLLYQSFYVNNNLSINGFGSSANITQADISASNGIIHVIDAVLLPDLNAMP